MLSDESFGVNTEAMTYTILGESWLYNSSEEEAWWRTQKQRPEVQAALKAAAKDLADWIDRQAGARAYRAMFGEADDGHTRS